jgi:hypothetical protein
MVKQLKNRWGDTNTLKRFIVGVDRSKMKLFDVEDSAQTGLVNDSNSTSVESKVLPFSERLKSEKPDFGVLK